MDTAPLQRALEQAFNTDELVTVVLVHAFKQGDPLALKEPVTEATMRAPSDLFLVKLIVGPGNPGPVDAPSTSPGIGIEVWLPTQANWNERVHTIGGLGGFDGGDHAMSDRVGWFYAALTAGAEGSVSASTNSGHTLRNGAWAMNPNGKPATQLWIDFAHRAMHEMAVKTKAIAAAFYGRPAKFAYYEGVSTGGRHGYRLAQQYPADYDGIIGCLPAMNWTEFVLTGLYRRLIVQRDLGGVELTEEQLDLVSNAAIHSSDVVGGEHLGYIMDNDACRYDPTKDANVLCVSDGGTNATAHCLTKAQANAVNKMWYGITSDGTAPAPELDNGVSTALGGKHKWYGMARGTSLYNAFFTKQDPFMRDILRAAAATGNEPGGDQVAIIDENSALAGPGFVNASGNGQALWRGMSYQQLADTFDRGVAREPDFANVASDDPDLSAFKARGGKFLSWHGWNDEAIPVQGTMRYYDRVIEKMGGLNEVQSFFKLYLVPGGGHMSPHGTSNANANPPAVAHGQFYKLLVDWVEKGIEPGRIELESPLPEARITQPVFPYPQKAKYIGGNPRVTTSYEGS